jgi:hypothetical protein
MSKHVLACLAAAVMACAASSAAAQTAPVLIPVVEAPARPADFDARAALVRRYFEAVQYTKLMNGLMESTFMHDLDNGEIPEDKRELVRVAALATFDVVIPQMMEISVGMYAEAFTLEELQHLVDFYEGPVGRSVMAKTVMMTRRTGETIEQFTPMIEDEMMRQLCSRMDCSGIEGASNRTKAD